MGLPWYIGLILLPELQFYQALIVSPRVQALGPHAGDLLTDSAKVVRHLFRSERFLALVIVSPPESGRENLEER